MQQYFELDPRQSLLDVLGETLALTGTKKGCIGCLRRDRLGKLTIAPSGFERVGSEEEERRAE